MNKRNASPLFHDVSQENLYLKAEAAKYQKMFSDLQSNYTYQKNMKLSKEYSDMKKDVSKLKHQLDEMTILKNEVTSKVKELSYSKTELLHKIVLLHELLQKETYRRVKETEEKHKLHLKVVKYQELSNQLKEQMQDKEGQLTKEEKKGKTLAAVIDRLQKDLSEKNATLDVMQSGVKTLQQRFYETQERLLHIEKSKEIIFHETLAAYKRQLNESDDWIASHFADIDRSNQLDEHALVQDHVIQSTEQIAPILETLKEQVQNLQIHLDAVQQNSEAMTVKIDGFKQQHNETTNERRILYTIEQKKENKRLMK
ncbi:sigmaE regulated sporulation protein [Bacillus sp. NPDC077027]|uniref:sigmaE regulated sporulation protein n=1 Tax=Bacillus sp. NPDC077027 TaxID=3390548 RepID=UPI003D04B4A3